MLFPAWIIRIYIITLYAVMYLENRGVLVIAAEYGGLEVGSGREEYDGIR
jgi:hypothetical protein